MRTISKTFPIGRIAPLTAGVALCLTSTTYGATIVVNNQSATSLPGSCTIVDAVASLNQGAIVAGTNCANSGDAFGTGDRIEFSSNFAITFTAPADSASSALVLTKPMTISGSVDNSGKPLVSIAREASAPSQFRLIQSGASLALSGLAIRGGDVLGDGGAVFVSGNAALSVTDSIISGNLASVRGGGIYASYGVVTLSNSTISGNEAPIYGGGVYAGGSVNAVNSTISGNSSDQGGGVLSAGTFVSTGTTISGNTATSAGGGIYAFGTSSLVNTTISGNSAPMGGAGIYASGDASFSFCTITGNNADVGGTGAGVALLGKHNFGTATLIFGNGPGNDIDGPLPAKLDGDHNLVGTYGTHISVPGDTTSCDPHLAPLTDNGGATQTHSLFDGSCALDAGPITTTIQTDQRGLSRNAGVATDIGAFEKQGPGDPPELIFANGFES